MPADEQPTLGEEIIAWIETHCRIPEGALVGQPLELMDWQRNFILQTYNNPARTRRAILSVPRKQSHSPTALQDLVGKGVQRRFGVAGVELGDDHHTFPPLLFIALTPMFDPLLRLLFPGHDPLILQ